MWLIQGNLKLVLLYGSISIALLLFFTFGTGPPERSRAEKARDAAAAERARVTGQASDRFNACIAAAPHNTRKLDKCKARHVRDLRGQ